MFFTDNYSALAGALHVKGAQGGYAVGYGE